MTAGSPAGLLAPAPAADRPDGRRAASAKRDVAIVVPTYNEAENLPLLVDRIFAGLPEDARLIVVDDGSPDGTGALAARLAERMAGAIELVQRNEKLGLGTAYRAGFERALACGADYVVQMDADLSHNPDSLTPMLAELGCADVVVGSRYVAGASVDPRWGPIRRLLSVAGNRGIGLLAGLDVRDATSGYKAFRASALAAIDLDGFRCAGFGFQVEMAAACQRLGLRVVEHPIRFRIRRSGRSKMSLGIVVEAVRRLTPMAWRRFFD